MSARYLVKQRVNVRWTTVASEETKFAAAAQRTRHASDGREAIVTFRGAIVVDVDGADLDKIPRRGFPK